MKIALLLFASVAAAIAAVFGLAYWRQEILLFAPQKLPADFALRQPDVFEETVAVDGAQLNALHLRLPDPIGVVFSLHGNAGSLASWFVDPDVYRRANFDLFMIDYRGYGKSTGRIGSEAQLRRDVDAAWQQVAPRYRGRRVVVFGRSLGTALAAGLAARIKPDLTILASPYWSMRDLAQLHYPFLPPGLLRYPLETWRDLAQVDGPVLLLHGDRDALIPDAHSRRLAAVAHDARVQIIAGAAHGDLQDFPAYRQAIADALAAVPR